MSEDDKNYELKVLKMIVGKYLEQHISISTECLNRLENDCDQIVWELAIKVYTQSGHKIAFSTVRDIIKIRIGELRHQIAIEEQRLMEQARLAAEEAQRGG